MPAHAFVRLRYNKSIMKRKYDLVCVGDVVMDAFIQLHEASVHCDLNHEHCELCMSFADKIPYESLIVVAGRGECFERGGGREPPGLKTAMFTAIGSDHYGEEILGRVPEGRRGAGIREGEHKESRRTIILC